jgi:hypothetical protein
VCACVCVCVWRGGLLGPVPLVLCLVLCILLICMCLFAPGLGSPGSIDPTDMLDGC